MPLYIHLSNLVLRKSDIKEHYIGGLEAFRSKYFWEDCNNQEDDELFGIAAMNPEELPFDELTKNGLEIVFKEGKYDLVNKYGAKSNVDWLVVNSPFMWHIDCENEQKQKAISVTTITMDKVSEEARKGNFLLKTIKSEKSKTN